MNCEQIQHQIIDFIDGNLTIDTMTQIEKHLQKCNTCQDEYLHTGELLNTIGKTEDIEPSANLRMNFYKMLEAEKMTAPNNSFNNNSAKKTTKLTFIKIAAQIVILIALGAIIAGSRFTNKKQLQQIAILHSEIQQIKNTASLVALSDPSASERLQAINSVNNQEFNTDIFEALINTMNNDKNINVRMSAMYALSKYNNNELVKSSFIESLKHQTDPLLQITLINILVNIQDKRAKDPIQDIINKKETPDVVKKQAIKSLQAFV